MTIELTHKSAASGSKLYSQFARYYDRFVSPIYQDRIFQTIEELRIPPGSRVLEIGVGTGVSLPSYPAGVHVCGIDLSAEMLRQAAERVETLGLKNIELYEMNACELDLPDASFDYVMAFHVASVVDDVGRLMRGIHRVCKPGGTVVVINHFRSSRWFVAPIVDLVNPITQHLGWRTTLRLEDLGGQSPLRVEKAYKLKPTSLFTVVIATKPH